MSGWSTSNRAYGNFYKKQEEEKKKRNQNTQQQQQQQNNIYDKTYNIINKNENLYNRNQNIKNNPKPNVTKPKINTLKNQNNQYNQYNQNNLYNPYNPIQQNQYKTQKNQINEPKLDIIFDPNKIITSKVGLQNLGNTCYMNSCLQILIHCPLFIYKFIESATYFFKNGIRPTPISNVFYELLLNVSNEQYTYFIPSNFKDSFTSLHKEFFDNLEHDTQEFCRFLLQDFNRELKTIETPSSYK